MSFKTGASVAALALTLGLTAAAAQQVSPSEGRPKTPLAGQIVTQPEETVLARDLIGNTVTSPDNTKIGSISDLLLGKDGKTVEGFIIGVGGFLGLGERNVALKMDQLKITPAADGTLKLTADLKKDDVANAPAFKSRKDLEAEKRATERPARPTSPGGPGTGAPPR